MRITLATLAGIVVGVLAEPSVTNAVPLQSSSTRASLVSPTSFVYPLMGPKESSHYGIRQHPIRKTRQHHDGIDLAAPRGAVIRAITDGRVMYADPYGGYGNLVVIKHAAGLSSHYGHCDAMKVRPGQSIKAGDIIATVGDTGRSTGPHLHFEIRRQGTPLHPETFLPGMDEPAQG